MATEQVLSEAAHAADQIIGAATHPNLTAGLGAPHSWWLYSTMNRLSYAMREKPVHAQGPFRSEWAPVGESSRTNTVRTLEEPKTPERLSAEEREKLHLRGCRLSRRPEPHTATYLADHRVRSGFPL